MKKTATMIYLALAFTTATAAEPTSAFETRKHDDHLCAMQSAWYAAKDMSIEVSTPQTEMTASYKIQNYDNGDIRITLRDPNVPSEGTAESMVVGGRALITKNIKAEENNPMDIMDLVALQQQLTLTLIDLAAQGGPERTTLPMHKDMSEKKYPIKATTPGATVLFGAPWNATVSLLAKGKGTISYKVRFTFISDENKKTDVQLEGLLSKYTKADHNPKIPDDFPISDWKQYKIDKHLSKTDSGTTIDLTTIRIEKPLATLGQLRSHIQPKDK